MHRQSILEEFNFQYDIKKSRAITSNKDESQPLSYNSQPLLNRHMFCTSYCLSFMKKDVFKIQLSFNIPFCQPIPLLQSYDLICYIDERRKKEKNRKEKLNNNLKLKVKKFRFSPLTQAYDMKFKGYKKKDSKILQSQLCLIQVQVRKKKNFKQEITFSVQHKEWILNQVKQDFSTCVFSAKNFLKEFIRKFPDFQEEKELNLDRKKLVIEKSKNDRFTLIKFRKQYYRMKSNQFYQKEKQKLQVKRNTKKVQRNFTVGYIALLGEKIQQLMIQKYIFNRMIQRYVPSLIPFNSEQKQLFKLQRITAQEKVQPKPHQTWSIDTIQEFINELSTNNYLILAYRIYILFELAARMGELKQITFVMIISGQISYIPEKQSSRMELARRNLIIRDNIIATTKRFINQVNIIESSTLNIGYQKDQVKERAMHHQLSAALSYLKEKKIHRSQQLDELLQAILNQHISRIQESANIRSANLLVTQTGGLDLINKEIQRFLQLQIEQ